MPCKQAFGRLLLVLVFLAFSVSTLSDNAPRVKAVQQNLVKTSAKLEFLATDERAKLLSTVIAGISIVGSVLVLVSARERYCVLGSALLLHVWLFEGLFTSGVTPHTIPGVLQATGILGGLLLT